MNWYKRFLTAAGPVTEYKCVIREGEIPGVNLGQKVCYIIGNSFPVKDLISRAGFKYDGTNRKWWQWPAALEKNIAAQNILTAPPLNIVLPSLSGIAQQTPQPSAKPISPQNPSAVQQTQSKNWILAQTIAKLQSLNIGLPVVMKLAPGGWEWEGEDGQTGYLANSQVKANVESVKDPMGKVMQSLDPKQLFQKWHEMNKQVETKSNGQWMLAKSVDLYSVEPGGPVVISSGREGNYIWQDRNTDSGQISEVDLPTIVSFVKDGTGKTIQSANPKELFAYFDKLNPKESFTPSPYQDAIAKTFANTNKNIMINALAGSGKTTTLRKLSEMLRPGEKGLYLVFNSRNQIEASEGDKKFPPGITVLTTHAFLGNVLSTSAKKGLFTDTALYQGNEEDGNKGGQRIYSIMDDFMDQDSSFPNPLRWSAKSCISEIVSKAKSCAVNPSSPDAGAEISNIINEYEIDTDLSTERFQTSEDWKPILIQKAIQVLNLCLPKQSGNPIYNSTRDHDDTLWYAALYAKDLIWPQYNVVLADEIQDFNLAQNLVLQKLKEKSRIVAVGDPNQALYMFRGADPQSFSKIEKMVIGDGSGTTHELPTNYRSGTEIINYVNKNTHVHNLQAGKKHKGKVTEGRDLEEINTDIENEWNTNNRKLRLPTTILCLNNAPLAEAAMSLIRSDIDFQIMGRDLSKELTKQIEKVTGKGKYAKYIPVEELATTMHQYMEDLENKWKNKLSKKKILKEMNNTTEALTSVLSHLSSSGFTDKRLGLKVTDAVSFINYIQKKFKGIDLNNKKDREAMKQKDPRSYVMLSTVHKSKGSEYKRVVIMEPGLFNATEKDTRYERIKKANAKYVGFTRAEIELHIANDTKD